MRKKIELTEALTLTDREIERAIFRGASCCEARGFSDAFTDEAIVGLIDHPDRDAWYDSIREWHTVAYFAALDRLGD